MTITAEWIDPDGTSLPLHVEYDIKGLFAPPVRIQEDAIPGQSGKRRREIVHDAREFVLSLYWRDDDPAVLWTTLREAAFAMDPARGAGKLRVTSPVGDQREINCVVTAGMDLGQTLGEKATPTHQRESVAFRAFDPYWYAPSDVVVEYTTGAVATFFPIFPLRLSTSTVFADSSVDTTGDVEVWPVWDITGPGSTITLANLTTGKTLTLSGITLAAGEVATIDTQPGAKTILKQDGTNLFPNAVGSLWSLTRGNNAVRVQMSGGTAASRVRLAYRPRWLTP